MSMIPLPLTDADRKILCSDEISLIEFRNLSDAYLFEIPTETWGKYCRDMKLSVPHCALHSFKEDIVLVFIWRRSQIKNNNDCGAIKHLLPPNLAYGALTVIYLPEFSNKNDVTVKYLKDRSGLAQEMSPEQQSEYFHKQIELWTRLR